MNDILKSLLIFILFYLVLSLGLALFAAIIWELTLANILVIDIGYFNWFGIIFISNLLRFDLIKKLINYNKLLDIQNKQENKKKEDNEIY